MTTISKEEKFAFVATAAEGDNSGTTSAVSEKEKSIPVPQKFNVPPNAIMKPDTTEYDKIVKTLSGPLAYSLTNDFIFKYTLQKNIYALKGLLAALLELNDEDIASINVLNPIQLGEHYDDKTCILDVKLLLNSNRVINIEMQVAFQYAYPERAILYLGRTFDHLSAAEGYDQILPCVQISIMDGEMFKADDPRYTDALYSEYHLTEKKTGKEFSDKFSIHVLSLKHIENATDQNEPNGIYRWAKLFTAKTWEDLKMIAQNNEYMKSMTSGLKVLTEDEKVQMAYEAREKEIRDRISFINSVNAEMAKIEEQRTEIEEQRTEIEEQRTEIEERGADRYAKLAVELVNHGRSDDIIRAKDDLTFRESLFKEFNL